MLFGCPFVPDCRDPAAGVPPGSCPALPAKLQSRSAPDPLPCFPYHSGRCRPSPLGTSAGEKPSSTAARPLCRSRKTAVYILLEGSHHLIRGATGDPPLEANPDCDSSSAEQSLLPHWPPRTWLARFGIGLSCPGLPAFGQWPTSCLSFCLLPAFFHRLIRTCLQQALPWKPTVPPPVSRRTHPAPPGFCSSASICACLPQNTQPGRPRCARTCRRRRARIKRYSTSLAALSSKQLETFTARAV